MQQPRLFRKYLLGYCYFVDPSLDILLASHVVASLMNFAVVLRALREVEIFDAILKRFE